MFERTKSWLKTAVMLALNTLTPTVLKHEPKDFTPKAIGAVKSHSHYNSKKSRASRQKRGW